MSYNAATASASGWHKARSGLWLGTLLGMWGAVIIALAVQGVFDVPQTEPAWPTLLAIAGPVFLFLAAVLFSSKLRRWVLDLDPVLLTELQAWRIMGGAFLVVYAFGILPGLFAWPAGLGDVAVGIAAPFMAWQLRNDPSFLTSGRYRGFLFFGLADFVVAVSTGIAARAPITGVVEQVTSAAMGQIPLVLIPTLAVPTFIILHLIVLMQITIQRK